LLVVSLRLEYLVYITCFSRFLPLHSAGAGEFNDIFFSRKVGGIFRSTRLLYDVSNVPSPAHLNALFMKTTLRISYNRTQTKEISFFFSPAAIPPLDLYKLVQEGIGNRGSQYMVVR